MFAQQMTAALTPDWFYGLVYTITGGGPAAAAKSYNDPTAGPSVNIVANVLHGK